MWTASATDLLAVLPLRVAKVFQSYAPLRIVNLPVDIASFDVKIHWHAERAQFAASAWQRNLVMEAMHEFE
jgi:hypothetical protein